MSRDLSAFGTCLYCKLLICPLQWSTALRFSSLHNQSFTLQKVDAKWHPLNFPGAAWRVWIRLNDEVAFSLCSSRWVPARRGTRKTARRRAKKGPEMEGARRLVPGLSSGNSLGGGQQGRDWARQAGHALESTSCGPSLARAYPRYFHWKIITYVNVSV